MDGSVRRNYGYTKRNHWTLAPPTDGLPKMTERAGQFA